MSKINVEIPQKTFREKAKSRIKYPLFTSFCFLYTKLFMFKKYNKVIWSVSDCYIEIGKTGFIWKSKLYDINGDITKIEKK
jgi:hypothetical protein